MPSLIACGPISRSNPWVRSEVGQPGSAKLFDREAPHLSISSRCTSKGSSKVLSSGSAGTAHLPETTGPTPESIWAHACG